VPLTVNTRRVSLLFVCAAASFVAGCKSAPPPTPPPQAMPVQVAPVTLSPVPNSDTYVATIKSRRSSTMQPQVDGNLVKIFVKSGDLVKAGQVLMRIDPLKQMATVQSQQGTQQQKKALYDYTQIEEERQRKLQTSPSRTLRSSSWPTMTSALLLRVSLAIFRSTWATMFRPPLY
jgi:multidrug efflux pump subunit AcrA (membrane-fusion protein)